MRPLQPSPIEPSLRRFGLAARPGEARQIAADPRGALLAQLTRAPAATPPELTDAAGALTAYAALRDTQAARGRARREMEMAGVSVEAAMMAAPGPASEPSLHLREIAWRLSLARDTQTPLLERLVLFWTNHFTVSGQGSTIAHLLAGAFEREAIRPHILGRFEDMLRAATLHPAMLIYLDNVSSIAQDSPLGRGRQRGVNENLAREVLELHSLGADGGYTQADVTEFAEVLSGFVVGYPGGPPRTGGSDRLGTWFQAERHAPGPKTILGRTYPEAGEAEAPAVLHDIARHPSTARYIARRLASHFVADPPPPALVDRLAQTFRETDGDLRAVTEALLRADIAWSAPAVKLRSPLEFMMCAARVTGRLPEPPQALSALAAMGQPWYRAPSPKGWDDTNDGWATPDGVKTRLDWARRFAIALDGRADPRAVAEGAFGPALSPTTRSGIAAAESAQQGFALLLMAPEMLRR